MCTTPFDTSASALAPWRSFWTLIRTLSGGFPECLQLAPRGQKLQCLGLDLPHALGRQPEPAARFAQRLRVVAVDPVAQLHDVALGLGQLLDGAPQGLLDEAHLHLLVHRRLAAL